MDTARTGQNVAATHRQGEFSLPGVLPIFPLPQTVLLPGEVLPLHVFEPRYRDLVKDALAGHRIFGVVAIEPGHEEAQLGDPPVRPVGCAGLIIRHVELPGGRFLIWLLGISGFTIGEELPSITRYRQVRIEVGDAALPVREAAAGREALRLDLLAALPVLAEGGADRTASLVQLLARVDDDQLVAGVAQLLEVDPGCRQELLEAASAADRMRLLKAEVDLRLKVRPDPPKVDPKDLN